MEYQDTTDAQLQAEFEKRNANLMNGMSGVLGSLNNAQKTFMENAQQNAQDLKDRTMETTYVEAETVITGPMGNSSMGNSSMGTRSMADSSKTIDDMGGPTLNTSHTGFHPADALNRGAIHAARRDVNAMHGHSATEFETVAAKLDDTFANNALTEGGPDKRIL
ncbi:hypothetical protein CLU79DRAFT_849492 [Phycomyces nitens]|nr:hypothetical protein CLU79DRAFT_849492 [Phycomyces nitens]